MMFSVRWARSALNELAEIWVGSSSDIRSEITAAAAKIDRLLDASPLDIGESRSTGIRVLFADGLAVEYHVLLDDRRVTVVRVWRVRRNRHGT